LFLNWTGRSKLVLELDKPIKKNEKGWDSEFNQPIRDSLKNLSELTKEYDGKLKSAAEASTIRNNAGFKDRLARDGSYVKSWDLLANEPQKWIDELEGILKSPSLPPELRLNFEKYLKQDKENLLTAIAVREKLLATDPDFKRFVEADRTLNSSDQELFELSYKIIDIERTLYDRLSIHMPLTKEDAKAPNPCAEFNIWRPK
jgi:hypothetical protein